MPKGKEFDINPYKDNSRLGEFQVKVRPFTEWALKFCEDGDSLEVIKKGGCLSVFNKRTLMTYIITPGIKGE
jgi:hypothetical protein